MGRQKIIIEPLPESKIKAKFKKRKNGLKNKAYELGTLCRAKVALIVISNDGTEVIGESFNGSIPEIFDMYMRYKGTDPAGGPSNYVHGTLGLATNYMQPPMSNMIAPPLPSSLGMHFPHTQEMHQSHRQEMHRINNIPPSDCDYIMPPNDPYMNGNQQQFDPRNPNSFRHPVVIDSGNVDNQGNFREHVHHH